jgi:predicted Ser/Thr protein kinase
MVTSSSMGRLFDAVSSLVGVRHVSAYEAQAAIELEAVATQTGATDVAGDPVCSFDILESGGILEIDPSPVLRAIVESLGRGVPPALISASFHEAVARAVLAVSRRLRNDTGETTAALSGGVFQNVRLLGRTVDLLAADGFRVLTHRLVPPNDGGLSLGQAACASRGPPVRPGSSAIIAVFMKAGDDRNVPSHEKPSLLSDPARWHRAADLFHAALERPAEQRDAFLSEACGADTDLRREVMSLLDTDRQASHSGLEAIGGELAASWIRDREAPQLAGKTLGRYEVLSRVGSGGMGDVYRARDRTLGRDVALKVLSPALLADPAFRRRLEDEARAASSLNHPNIITVYEIGREGTVDFIASEFVDGGTLREAMNRGRLTPTEILDIAGQVCAALSAAHASGLVHRDIKPENVMLRRDGIVKLVDFGIAKLAPPGGAAALSTLTRTGAVQGTACYMSPEQALRERLDHRSDLFSFGIVLYEMATGRRPFDGASDAARYDALLNAAPAAPTTLRPDLPAGLDLVVERALEKAPELRYQSAADLAADLKRLHRPTTSTSVAARRPSSRRTLGLWLFAAVAAAAAIAAAAATVALRRDPSEAPVVRSTVPPPAGAAFTQTGTLVPSVTFAISPDGRRLAFLAARPGARPMLWVRALDGADASPLAGTEGATYPFWSPEGRSLAFFAEGSLKRIDIDGGTPLTLAENIEGRGGAWSRDDVILYAVSEGPILRVPATGGPSRAVTTLDAAAGETWHRFPQLLPDQKHFLYLARNGDNVRRLFAGSLDDSGLKTPVLETNAKAAYADPGYLLPSPKAP